jgi:hypothetical protein
MVSPIGILPHHCCSHYVQGDALLNKTMASSSERSMITCPFISILSGQFCTMIQCRYNKNNNIDYLRPSPCKHSEIMRAHPIFFRVKIPNPCILWLIFCTCAYHNTCQKVDLKKFIHYFLVSLLRCCQAMIVVIER